MALAALAGLNPWVVLVIVTGLATYTRHAPLNEPYSQVTNPAGPAVFAALLGIEVVASKLKRVAQFIEAITLPAAAVTGALLPLALVPHDDHVVWLVPSGLGVALALRWARNRSGTRLNRWLQPYGYIAAGMAGDLIAGVGTAAVFAVRA